MPTLKPAADSSLCQLSSWSKSTDVTDFFCCFWSFLLEIVRFMFSFPHQDRPHYQRRHRLDLHHQNSKISFILSGLGLRQGPNFIQNASFYKKLQSNKNENAPNKAQKSTALTNQTDLTKKIQIGRICINAIFKLYFTLLTFSLPISRLEKRTIERKIINISLPLWSPFLGCYQGSVFPREIKKLPPISQF